MPKFMIRVIRNSHIEEVGYMEVEGDNVEHACELAAEMDDPDEMVERWSESQSHDYEDATVKVKP